MVAQPYWVGCGDNDIRIEVVLHRGVEQAEANMGMMLQVCQITRHIWDTMRHEYWDSIALKT